MLVILHVHCSRGRSTLAIEPRDQSPSIISSQIHTMLRCTRYYSTTYVYIVTVAKARYIMYDHHRGNALSM